MIGKLISYVRKVGYRTAEIFGYTPREAPPTLYIEKIAKRKITRKKLAASRYEDAKRAAARAIMTEAHARLAIKRYKVKEEKKTYEYLTSHRARLERRRLRRAQLAAMEKASLAKRTLKKSIREYSGFLKKKEYKRREFERKFEKTAREIRYEIETAFSWQMVFRAKFLCPERKKPTKTLEGYSGVRFTRKAKPSLSEQNEMREEAKRWIIAQYLDGNSECEPIENTITIDLRRRDLKKEGEGMRKARLDKEAKKEKLRAKMQRERVRKRR